MNRKIRFHAIAIAAICIVTITAYKLLGASSSNQPAKTKSPYTITIVSATWGSNCSAYIRDYNETLRRTSPPKDNKGEAVATPFLTEIAHNNVKPAVEKLCAGQPNCTFNVTPDMLAGDPVSGCYKRLEVVFRCHDVGRIRTTHADQGSLFTIDCDTLEQGGGSVTKTSE